MRSNDLVDLGFAEALLREAGIPSVVLDQHTSVAEGSVLAIRRRLMVADEDVEEARAILREAGLDGGA